MRNHRHKRTGWVVHRGVEIESCPRRIRLRITSLFHWSGFGILSVSNVDLWRSYWYCVCRTDPNTSEHSYRIDSAWRRTLVADLDAPSSTNIDAPRPLTFGQCPNDSHGLYRSQDYPPSYLKDTSKHETFIEGLEFTSSNIAADVPHPRSETQSEKINNSSDWSMPRNQSDQFTGCVVHIIPSGAFDSIQQWVYHH